MKKLLSLLAVTLMLSACGTTKGLDMGQVTAPIGKGQARIVVERDNSLLYVGAGATIEINGAKVETLGLGGAVTKDVRAGQVAVSAQATASFGKFTVRFVAQPGKTYRFKVSPKSDALLLGSAFGIVGDAVNAQISDTSGYFQIEMVP